VKISPRYFFIELLTGLVFLGLFILYFQANMRDGIGSFTDGGWIIYLIHIIMLGAFIAASAIDLEYWVIPLSICWLVTAAGLVGSSVGVYLIDPSLIRTYRLLPSASAQTAALAAGATIGMVISLVLLMTGLLKRSYESEGSENENLQNPNDPEKESTEPHFNHRLEACREIVFLMPIIVCSIAAYWICKEVDTINTWWVAFTKNPAIAGFLGSLLGYFVGCGIVWGVRIFGTLAFGKEAMGLGDVHLMGAAGTVVGPLYVVLAFFVAPFFGLAWACFNMFFKKIRQIPYGPFLSLGIFVVMILHDRIRDYLSFMFFR
jgi:leader peptidase (prepilin peptidase)/N-methyltransferase